MESVAIALFGLLQFLGALSALVIASAAVRKWPMLVLWATAVLAVISWEFPAPITVANVAGTQIKIEDVLFVLFTLDTLIRPKRLVALAQRYAFVLSVIGLSLIASLVGGMLAFGPAAINDARNYYWGVGLVAWMLNQDWSEAAMQKGLRRWAAVVGWALVVAFTYHAARYGMGTADSFVEVGDGNSQTGRPLISQQAILLACFGLMMFWRTDLLKPKVASGLVFITVAVLCQHRSVWVGIGLAIVLALLKLRGHALGNTVFWGLYGCLILLIPYLAGAFDPLMDQLSYAATSAGTYTERADSWQLLITQAIHNGPGTVFFGQSFGTGYDRVVDGRFVSYSPHNWFVMIFLRLGLPCFLAYMVVMVLIVLPKLLKAKGIAAAVLVAVLAYSWTYAMPWYLSPVIGWCVYEALKGGQAKKEPKPFKTPAPSSAYKHLSAREVSQPQRLG